MHYGDAIYTGCKFFKRCNIAVTDEAADVISSYAIGWMKPTIDVKPPQIARPYLNRELSTLIEWTPYPSQKPSFERALNGVFDELYNLYEVGADLYKFLYVDD